MINECFYKYVEFKDKYTEDASTLTWEYLTGRRFQDRSMFNSSFVKLLTHYVQLLSLITIKIRPKELHKQNLKFIELINQLFFEDYQFLNNLLI